MPVKVEIYTTPTCPYCPYATRMMREIAPSFGENVVTEEVSTWSPEGQARALKHGIIAVPTIVVNDKVKFVGVPRKEDLVKAIQKELKNTSP